MSHRLPLLLLLATATALGGCGGTRNRGLESVHQPVVSRTDYVFDVSAGGDGLVPGETERLAGWMESLRVGYGDRVSVDDPSPYGDSAARRTVGGLAARYGLLLDAGAPLTAGAVPPGMVRVVVSRSRATVPGCPDFSRTSQPEFDGNSSSNFGCAINSNLAAMVANPEDLVRGQPGTTTDPATGSKAIDQYRKAPPTGASGLKTESAGAK